jgi:hypothetical protein
VQGDRVHEGGGDVVVAHQVFELAKLPGAQGAVGDVGFVAVKGVRERERQREGVSVGVEK